MSWFLIALVTPIAHAAVNHIDKYLLSKYLKNGQVGSLVLFSALFAFVALPFITWIDPTVFAVSLQDMALLMINGLLLVVAYIFYFYALDADETSIVAPMFQLVPIFGFILGYVVLGEYLTKNQIAGSIIVICGAVLLSLNFTASRISIKRTVLLYMIASSLLYAINGVLFKFIAEDVQRFWPSLFWDFMGKGVFGIVIFLTITSYRVQFLKVLKENRLSILGLNSFNELLAIIGEGAGVFAILLAPVALVQVVGGFQPFFVLLFGIALTLLFPRISQESLAKKDLFQKCAGIFAIILGTIIISYL